MTVRPDRPADGIPAVAIPADAIADAAVLLRGIAEEARFDRMRGVELWCDEDLAQSLRELFRTVAIAQREARRVRGDTQKAKPVTTSANEGGRPTAAGAGNAPTAGAGSTSAAGAGNAAVRRSGYQKALDAIESGTSGSGDPRTAATPRAQAPPTSSPAGTQAPATSLPSLAPSAPPSTSTPVSGPKSSASPVRVSRPPTSGGAASPPSSAAHAKRPDWGSPPIASGRDAGWADQLAAVEAEAKKCQACRLCETRRNVVFGVGSGHVPVVFVGEAPGADEDRQGFPIVGRAGELLTRIIQAIGLDRDEVYIANILKCRPPANRNPSPDEITRCTPFLTRQLEILRPKVICTLGLFASQFLLESTQSMGRMRGQRFTYERIPVIPTYHPAALLRNPDFKAKVWEDVQLLRKILDEAP